jgi:hypothetical protein
MNFLLPQTSDEDPTWQLISKQDGTPPHY